jgi:hypothetical protein
VHAGEQRDLTQRQDNTNEVPGSIVAVDGKTRAPVRAATEQAGFNDVNECRYRSEGQANS